jgi:hypothetical protein
MVKRSQIGMRRLVLDWYCMVQGSQIGIVWFRVRITGFEDWYMVQRSHIGMIGIRLVLHGTGFTDWYCMVQGFTDWYCMVQGSQNRVRRLVFKLVLNCTGFADWYMVQRSQIGSFIVQIDMRRLVLHGTGCTDWYMVQGSQIGISWYRDAKIGIRLVLNCTGFADW